MKRKAHCNELTSQWGYYGFQVGGMIEGLFGFEIFHSGMFWVGKFGKYFFGGFI